MDATPVDRRKIVGLTAAFEGGLLILALVLGWWFGTPPFGQLRPSWAMFALGAMVSLLLFAAATPVFRLRWPPLVRLKELLEQVVTPLFARCTVLDLALISVLAGVCEEAFFRGFLQTALADVMDPALALAVASVAFGLAHFISPVYAVTTALIGALFGWLLLHFGSLLVPIVAHAGYDFVFLTYLIHIRGIRQSPASESRHRRPQRAHPPEI